MATTYEKLLGALSLKTPLNIESDKSLFCNSDLVKASIINKNETLTKSRNVEILGSFFGSPFVLGNGKISKNTAIFSLLPVTTCGNCSNCKHSCYAVKALVRPNVWDKRLVYTYLAFTDLARLKTLLISDLNLIHDRIHYVRIHESGEFFNQSYLDMWTDIAALFPGIVFYSYTKMENVLDFSVVNSMDNFHIVKSLLPDGSKNYGNVEFIKEKVEKYGFPVCPYGRVDNFPKCGKCTLCMHNKYVLFLEH